MLFRSDDEAISAVGDREVQIQGTIGALDDEQDRAVRNARKRLKRSGRRVEEVLERLSTAPPDGLSG